MQTINTAIGDGAVLKLTNFKALNTKEQKCYKSALQSCIICNSCRYCEGLCAVFPAMEKKREFDLNDMDYLANLCHQCSECFYDCQYAPPHEFDVSIPAQFAAVRQKSYEKYAPFKILSHAFEKNALFTSIVLLVALFVSFLLARAFENDSVSEMSGNFFAVVPYEYMVGAFSFVSALVFIALCVSIYRFAKGINLRGVNLGVLWQSLKDALTLRYLGGHKNEGCTYPHERRSNARKLYHHLTAYGFLFCFIATSLGVVWTHFLGLNAPYDFNQAPKIFGLIGGIMLCIGTAGLMCLKLIADKELIDKKSVGMDYALIFMLFASSLSGLLLMICKNTPALAFMLYLHLSTIMALFVMIPYSKFIHIFYRFIALLKYNADEFEFERRFNLGEK